MTDQRTTKERIVDAALVTLREEGFAGTSARAIARHGGFNQALIFYHFGTLNDLLLTALDRTSEERLAAYRQAIGAATTVEEKIRASVELYRKDLVSGHVTVITEMIGGSLSRPNLGPEIITRMEPWVSFVEESMGDILERTGLAAMLPPRTVALAVVGLSLGMNLIWYLERDQAHIESIFEMAGRLTQFVVPMLGEERNL